MGQNHERFQYSLTMKVSMFRRMGIDANLKKTKAVLCAPGFIWGKGGERVYM